MNLVPGYTASMAIAHELFLPPVGEPDPEPRWRVTYATCGELMKVRVEVCAPDKETAVMRAGMKHSEMHKHERRFFKMGSWPKWERISVEQTTQ